MKHKLSFLLAVLFLFCASHTQAGFRIKKSSLTPEISNTISNTPEQTHTTTKKEQRLATIKTVKRLIHYDNGRPGHRRHSDSGWEGIVALVCGILGLVTGYLAIPAIIFGALGMGRGHVHRGMALAGFIMGIVVVALVTLVLVLYSGFWGI